MKKKLIGLLVLILIGAIIGILISCFQYLAHLIINGANFLITAKLWVFIITIFGALIGIYLLMIINKKHPGYYGSGIPQFEGYQHWDFFINPYKMLILMFVNSFYAFFTFFLLGSEGPSISIASSIGLANNRIAKNDDKHLVAACGSAGFACAFLSPLAGLCHLLEENKKIISGSLLIKGIIIIGISFIVSYLIYPHSLLPTLEINNFGFKYYYAFIPLIILSVLVARLFIFINIKLKDFNIKYKIISYITPLLLIAFMIIARFHPILVGSGSLILSLDIVDYSLLILFGLLVFRLIATAISANSNISGGIVLPTLALGVICGSIIVNIIGVFDSDVFAFKNIFIICGMLIVFSSVTKTPLTAFVLGLKCGNIKYIILPLFITISLSYLIIFKFDNLYHKLEKRLPGYNN